MSEVAPSGRNRRIYQRRACRRTTKITCRKGDLDLGLNIALHILDVSETGICMVVKENLASNQDVSLNLEATSHRRPLRVVARVVWCVEAADKTFCVGAEFHKRLPYAELLKLT